jgi:hypothetical protein
MALVLADRVQETSTTTGTGTLTLAGAVAGYQTFAAGIGFGNTCYYTITSDTGAWEIGVGTVGTGTLARTTLISSSTGGAISFSGTLTVFVTYPAEKAVYLDAANAIVPTVITSVTGTAPVVSSGGATPAISMAAASASANGYLTSTDWTTFNSKGTGTVTSVSATAPVTSTGGATPTIAMAAATAAVNGYLTSTDWSTFNAKLTSGGALGTPSSGTVTNLTGTASININGTVGATTPSTGSFTTLTSSTSFTPTAYTETIIASGTVGASATLAITAGTVLTATLTSATACTFTMPTATAGKSFTLLLKQPAAGTPTTATFTGVKWNANGAPTITATLGRLDIIAFVADGTNWYGTASQGYTY